MKMFKTTIVIWSDFNPKDLNLSELAYEAESGGGAAHCSKTETVSHRTLEEAHKDPDWECDEVFGDDSDNDHCTDDDEESDF